MPEEPVDDLDRDAPVMMLREIVSGYRLERTSRVTAKALDEGAPARGFGTPAGRVSRTAP